MEITTVGDAETTFATAPAPRSAEPAPDPDPRGTAPAPRAIAPGPDLAPLAGNPTPFTADLTSDDIVRIGEVRDCLIRLASSVFSSPRGDYVRA